MFRCVLALLIGLSAFSLAAPLVTTAMVVTVQQADVDQDGRVTVMDLALVAKSIGMTSTGRVDVDGDGKVTILDLTAVAMHLLQTVPARTPVEQLIATRPDHAVPHEITLPAPMAWWSWGQHGTEDTKFKQPDSGSVAPWLVVFRDASVINSPTNARFNVRRIALWNYQPSTSTWVKLFDGLPQWSVSSNPDTTSGYTDIAPTWEADGSYSFPMSAGRVLHMAAGPSPSISEGSGIVVVVEARLLGTSADIAAAKAAAAAGADYRAPGGDFSQGMNTPGYYASGFGQFGLLTADWRAFDMISSTLTDDQVRANPPPLP